MEDSASGWWRWGRGIALNALSGYVGKIVKQQYIEGHRIMTPLNMAEVYRGPTKQ